MRRWARFRQDDFTGGMVKRRAPFRLEPNECSLLSNYELGDYSFATKRDGFELMGSTFPVALRGIDIVYTGTTPNIIAFSDGNIYVWDEGGGSWSEEQSSVLNVATHVFSIPVELATIGQLIVLDGVSSPQIFNPNDGSIATLGGTPPVASFGAVYYKHLFLNSVTEPLRVYYSETDDFEAGYSGTNYFFDVDTSDFSNVTGFHTLDNELVIAKAESITSLRGTNPRDFSQSLNRAAFTNEHGLLSAWAVMDVGGVPWFIAENGAIYSLEGRFLLREQSLPVDGITSEMVIDPVSPQHLIAYRPFGVRRITKTRDQAIFFFRHSGATSGATHALVGHPGLGRNGMASWTLWDLSGIVANYGPVTCAVADRDGILYLGTAGTGAGTARVLRMTPGAYNDGVAVVGTSYMSPTLNPGGPRLKKTMREVGVEAMIDNDTIFGVQVDANHGETLTTGIIQLGDPSFSGSFTPGIADYGSTQIKAGRFQRAMHGFDHRVRINHTINTGHQLAAVEADTVIQHKRKSR